MFDIIDPIGVHDHVFDIIDDMSAWQLIVIVQLHLVILVLSRIANAITGTSSLLQRTFTRYNYRFGSGYPVGSFSAMRPRAESRFDATQRLHNRPQPFEATTAFQRGDEPGFGYGQTQTMRTSDESSTDMRRDV